MSQDLVALSLIDFGPSNNLFELLRQKFTNQQKGKQLWLRRRDKPPSHMLGFLPIEFIHDVSYISRFLVNNICQEFFWKQSLRVQNRLAKEFNFEESLLQKAFQNEKVIRNVGTICKDKLNLTFGSIDSKIIEKITRSENVEFTRNDWQLMDLLIKLQSANSLLYLDDDMSTDPYIVKKILETDKFAFSNYFHERFRKSRKAIWEIVVYNPTIYRFIDESLKFDRELTKRVLESDGTMLEFIPYKSKFDSDIELCSIAVRNNHQAIKFVSPNLKHELETIYRQSLDRFQLNACLNPDEVLQIWENSKFKYEKEIILTAIKKRPQIFFQINDDLKDSEIVLGYLSTLRYGQSIDNILPYLNEEIVLEMIEKDAHLFSQLPEEYKNNYSINEKVIQKFPLLIRVTTPEMQNNYSLVMQAVKKSGAVLSFASESLRNNLEICTEAISNDGKAYVFIGPLQEHNNELLILSFLSQQPNYIPYLKENVKGDYSRMCLVHQFSILENTIHPSYFSYEDWIQFGMKTGYFFAFSEKLLSDRLDYEYFGAKIY